MGHICFAVISQSPVHLQDEEIDNIFGLNSDEIDYLVRTIPAHSWDKEVESFLVNEVGFEKVEDHYIFDPRKAEAYNASGVEDDWIYIVDPGFGWRAMTPFQWLDHLVRTNSANPNLFVGTLLDAHV